MKRTGRTRRAGAVIAVLGLLAACGVAQAAEGRIPIFEGTFLDGTSTNVDGKYTVVRNIESGTGPTIRVLGTGSERIEINLNGFTVKRLGDGPAIFVFNVRSFIVRNGSVTSEGTVDSVVHVERSSGAGEVIVESLRVSGGGTGILLMDVPNFRIRDNIVSGTRLHGIQALGQTGITIGGSVENNQVLGVSSFGIWVGKDTAPTDGLIIRGNRVDAAGDDGILIKLGRGFIIDSNTVTDSGNSGIKVQASSAGRVTGNTVSGCSTESGAGINVINGPEAPTSDNSSIAGNVVSNNLGWGIAIQGSGHRIQDNIVNGNGLGGLSIGGNDNTFGSNTSRNNGGTPTCATSPPGQCASPDFCDDGMGNSSSGANLMPGGC